MICKECGKEMIKGYIQCRYGVYWSEKKRPVAAIPTGDVLALHSPWSMDNPFSGYYVEAYKCSECKRIMIEYSDTPDYEYKTEK